MKHNLEGESNEKSQSLINVDRSTRVAANNFGGPGGRKELSARDIATALFRHKWMILVLFLVIATGSVVSAILKPKQYKSHMKILVKNARADVVVTPERTNGAGLNNVTETEINSEVELLKSSDLLEQVVLKSGLAKEQSSTPSVTSAPQPRSMEGLVQKLERDLEIVSVKKANIIQISYTAKSPEIAVSVLQNLADLYLEKHLKLHRPAGTREFFEGQTDRYKSELRDSERRLATFQQKRNLISLNKEKELNLQKMADVTSELLAAEAAVNEATKRIAEIEQQLGSLDRRIITDSREIPSHGLVQSLSTTLVELRNRRTQLLTKFQPGDRLVKEVDQQIKDTTAVLDGATKTTTVERSTNLNPLRQTLETELAKEKLEQAGQRARHADLGKQVQQYQALLAKLDSATIEHDNMVRQVITAEDNHQLYAKKQEEARIADALDQEKITNVSIAEAPTVPESPSGPNRRLNMALGLFLAGFVSLGSVFCAEFFRDTVHTPRELESFTGLPVLATVAKDKHYEIGLSAFRKKLSTS